MAEPLTTGNGVNTSPRTAESTDYIASLARVYDRSGDPTRGSSQATVEPADFLAPSLMDRASARVPAGMVTPRRYSGTEALAAGGEDYAGPHPEGNPGVVQAPAALSWLRQGTRAARVEQVRGVPLPRPVPGVTVAVDGFIIPDD